MDSNKDCRRRSHRCSSPDAITSCGWRRPAAWRASTVRASRLRTICRAQPQMPSRSTHRIDCGWRCRKGYSSSNATVHSRAPREWRRARRRRCGARAMATCSLRSTTASDDSRAAHGDGRRCTTASTRWPSIATDARGRARRIISGRRATTRLSFATSRMRFRRRATTDISRSTRTATSGSRPIAASAFTTRTAGASSVAKKDCRPIGRAMFSKIAKARSGWHRSACIACSAAASSRSIAAPTDCRMK